MNLVPATIGKAVARNTLLAQKNAPQILFGAGVAGMVGSTILACRATLKMDELLEESAKKVEEVKNYQHPEFSESDRQRDLTHIRFKTGVKIVKLYAPSVILGGVSIVLLTKSHRILTTRNAALTAAYTALDKGFTEYRARVVEKYGEDEDRNLRYGSEKVQIEDPDTNKKRMITRVATDEVPSIYAVFFDERSRSWNPEPAYNKAFLISQQNWANDKLKARGHLFLNEVYEMLGLPHTTPGSVVGWVISRDGASDNYIDFGLFDGKTQAARDFVNGLEGAILLDFNVDGVIYHKIDELGKD